jgi:hypothetical protein
MMVMFVVMCVGVIMIMVVYVVVIMIMVMYVVVIMIMVMYVVVIMMMFMGMMLFRISGFFLFPVHCHPHMGSGDSAFDGRLGRHLHPRQPDGIHPVNESLPVLCQLQQCRGQHIARRAHAAFQIQCFHRFSSPPVRRFRCCFLMLCLYFML